MVKEIKKYTHHITVNSEIEFQINGKEVVGIVLEVNIRINSHQKAIWYEVDYNGDIILVDGETYQIIK